MRKLNIYSPFRNVRYTVPETVAKLLERRNFEVHQLEISAMPFVETSASDWDGIVKFDFETLPSLWMSSVDCHVKGEIPFHITDAGRLELGLWQCMEVPGWKLPDYGTKEEIKKNNMPHVEIYAACDHEKDEISFLWDFYSKDEEQRQVQETLIRVVTQAILQRVLGNICVDNAPQIY
jgi:hypothetical protein